MKHSALVLALSIGLQAAPPFIRATFAATEAVPAATWNLSSLYADDAAWEASRVKVQAGLSSLKALQGTLGTSPRSLLDAMNRLSVVRREIQRLDVYASVKSDEDTRVTANQARRQSANSLETQFSQATAFLAPEIIAIGSARIDAAVAAEPGLAPHAYALRTMLRQASHTLSSGEEALMAAAGDPLSQPKQIYGLLTNADLPWPTINVRGVPVTVDQNTYIKLRDDQDPQVREAVFQAFWPVYRNFQRTIGSVYAAHLRGVVFDARAHKFDSSLASFLSAVNTPDTVYRTLVAETNAGLPTLHRYLKLRARLLGLKEQKYSDIYAAVAKPPRSYSLAEGEQLTLQAVKPLGNDYVAALGRHFQERWMDAVPRKGKRSGAYMNAGAYDVHPYLLMSFNDDYQSVSTLAHEWGHAMHSVLGNAAQPFETADYGIFVAEIPSTTNEMLLGDYVTAHATTKEEKIYALTQQLDGLRGTFFRQAMFAEFELKVHDAAEKDQPLTGEDFTRIYLDLLRRYHGDAQGVMKIEELYGSEWEFIPHFYNDYYVYQYATSISAAAYFAEGIEKGDADVRTKFLNMLKAGGSDDPYRVVKNAGLDMASPAPYRALVQRMNRLLDELEAVTGGAATAAR